MILLELFLVFFLIGIFTFGGGYAMIQMMQEILVAKGWVSAKEMIDFIAISESTPGAFAINVSTFVGYRLAGVLGGVISTLGAVLPSIIVITIIASNYKKFSSSKIINNILQGIRPVVIGLIISVAVTLSIQSFVIDISSLSINYNTLLIALTIFSIKFRYKNISPILLIIIGGLLGLIML